MAGKALPLSRLYVDGASVDHHRFGPYPPLQENMKKLKDTLMTNRPSKPGAVRCCGQPARAAHRPPASHDGPTSLV
jgi:hypothetical protein